MYTSCNILGKHMCPPQTYSKPVWVCMAACACFIYFFFNRGKTKHFHERRPGWKFLTAMDGNLLCTLKLKDAWGYIYTPPYKTRGIWNSGFQRQRASSDHIGYELLDSSVSVSRAPAIPSSCLLLSPKELQLTLWCGNGILDKPHSHTYTYTHTNTGAHTGITVRSAHEQDAIIMVVS